MSQLALAREEQVDEIYRQSHRLWGAGLCYEDYRGLWDDVTRTPWAQRHVRFQVWADARGRILSSMKLYRPRVRWFGRTTRAAVIGAIFTPESRRRRGHASRMMRAAIEEARGRGDGLALLFSDIGSRYYASLGFRELPAQEQWGRLPAPGNGSGTRWELREMSETDFAAVVAAHDGFCRKRPIAVLRDVEHWRFLRARSERFFERLGDPSIRQQFRIALRDGRFAGYLISVEGGQEWNVREVGAVAGNPVGMAAILRLGADRARRDGLRSFYGWLPPPLLDHLDGWNVRQRARSRALPMVLVLGDDVEPSTPTTPGAAYLPFQDQF